MNKLIEIRTEEDKKALLDQYKIVVDSLNKINDIREWSNTFWTGVNGALIGSIAYIKEMHTLGEQPKQLFLLTVIFLGILMCLTWLSYLATIKKNIDVRNKMVIEFEKYLPAKPFTHAILKLGRNKGKDSLSFKEMRVPLLFLVGYIFFAIAFFFI